MNVIQTNNSNVPSMPIEEVNNYGSPKIVNLETIDLNNYNDTS